MTLRLDLETVSTQDLRRTGVYRYAECPTTDVILACFKREGTVVETWRPGMPVPHEVKEAVETGENVAAWNSQFEAALWFGVLAPKYGWPAPDPNQFDCTMSRAQYWGWPASLELACEAMGLQVQKDKAGHALMLRMCRPRSFNEDGTPAWWHAADAHKYDALNAYCVQDVLAEEAAASKLPPLPATERKIWLLDQKSNRRGMPVDTALVEAMQRVAKDAERAMREAVQTLTGGAVSGVQSHAALAKWLNEQGIDLPDLRADTVRAWVAKLPDCTARDVLILRRDGAKASVAKLRAFSEAVCRDGHIKGLTKYYGAGRTGRWSGAGGGKFQLQNLPRGSIKRPDTAIEMILNGCDAEGLELLFEDGAMGVLASCLRGIICAN